MTFTPTTNPSVLQPQQDGWCRMSTGDGKQKGRYPTAEEASMGLVEARENYLARDANGRCPIAYYECRVCDGFHLTSHPRPETVHNTPPRNSSLR